MSRRIPSFLFVLLSALLTGIVILSLWYPVLTQYHQPSAEIPPSIVNASISNPPDSILRTLDQFDFWLDPGTEGPAYIVVAAESAMVGVLPIPLSPSVKIGARFAPSDLELGSSLGKVYVAGLYLPRLLLDAYEVIGREEYYERAKSIMLDFATYQESVVLPKGDLFIAHAVSSQCAVAAKFWRLYRNHEGFDQTEASRLLAFAERAGLWLCRPDQFAYASNQGIMQNLALWHLCLAFPELPSSQRFATVALSRMQEQMQYYVDDEGVVLEHSAGYQFDGVTLLGVGLRYMTLLDIPVPDDWRLKYDRARQYYANIQRPNRTLPKIGDTEELLDPEGPLIASPDSGGHFGELRRNNAAKPVGEFTLYPLAGFAVWWSNLDYWPQAESLNQTTVTWSYFPGHAHKLADELSVVVWASGHDWWTNMGYAAYDTPERLVAESWEGSDAPHLRSESPESRRESRVESHGDCGKLRALDISRQGPGNYQARRQIINLLDDTWIVIDHTNGDDTSKTATQWTVSRNVDVLNGPDERTFSLRSKQGPATMDAFFLTSPSARLTQYRASRTPFAGWEFDRMVPQPTWSLCIEQPADSSWAVAVWQLRKGEASATTMTPKPTVNSITSPTEWELDLTRSSSVAQVSRHGDTVRVRYGKGLDSSAVLILSRGEDVTRRRAELATAFKNASDHYRHPIVIVEPRPRLTWLLLVILGIQEAFFLAWRRRSGYLLLRIMSFACWIAGGIWLVQFYLA